MPAIQIDVDTGTWVEIHCNHQFFSQIIDNIFLKLKQIFQYSQCSQFTTNSHIKIGLSRCAFVGVILRYQSV